MPEKSVLARLWLSLSNRKVPYVIGEGVSDRLPELLIEQKLNPFLTVVAADRTVSMLHGYRMVQSLSRAGLHAELVELEGGEARKNLETVALFYEKLLDLHATRSTLVAALGGGVITDLVGFAASTFMRGLPLLLVPTTLLSQADAAVGGKTGVNLPRGKNLVGTFYHPRLVAVDPAVLKTLPEPEWKNGMAEIVKMCLLEGEDAFEELEAHVEKLPQNGEKGIASLLVRAIRGKIEVVEADPEERGGRMRLNLGHTFAHALEAATRYEAYTHGQAVSIGLVWACCLAEKALGLKPKTTERVERLLQGIGLPSRYRGVSPETLLAAMASDKKKRERLCLVLPAKIGKVLVRDDISETMVLGALNRVKED